MLEIMLYGFNTIHHQCRFAMEVHGNVVKVLFPANFDSLPVEVRTLVANSLPPKMKMIEDLGFTIDAGVNTAMIEGIEYA